MKKCEIIENLFKVLRDCQIPEGYYNFTILSETKTKINNPTSKNLFGLILQYQR